MAATMHGYASAINDNSIQKNMLIYGPPGTGKTECTAVLSKMLKAPAFLVGIDKKNDEQNVVMSQATREERIKALQRSAFIMKTAKIAGFLVLDEAEDILRLEDQAGVRSPDSKQYSNYVLENLGVPVIFITNQRDYDLANVRRIEPAFCMDYMPVEVKAKVIRTMAQKASLTISEDASIDLAQKSRDLRVAEMVKCVSSVLGRWALQKTTGTPEETFVEECSRVIASSLTLRNKGVPPLPEAPRFKAEGFKTELVASDQPAMFSALAQKPQAMVGHPLLVFGRPGTGRTALAQALVQRSAKNTKIPPRVLRG